MFVTSPRQKFIVHSCKLVLQIVWKIDAFTVSNDYPTNLDKPQCNAEDHKLYGYLSIFWI